MNYLTPEKPLERLWRTIYRRKLLIAAIFSLVVISGLIATLLMTPKYEATMSLMISRNRADPQVSAGEKTADVLLTGISDEEFNSELELFKNGEVIAGAIRDLDLVNNQKPAPHRAFGGLGEKLKSAFGTQKVETPASDEFALERTTTRVMNNLSVEPIKKSRIIKISYTDTDPVRAKKTLEKIYQRYVELHVNLGEQSAVETVFGEQSAEFEQKLNASTNALKRFDQTNGLSGADSGMQSEMLLRQVYELDAQAAQTRTEISETGQRVRALTSKIAAQPEQIQTGSQSKYVAALDRLKDELTQLNQEKTRLLQKYKPNTRFVIEIEARIQNANRAIAAESANPPQERSFALNDLRRRLESDLSNAQIALPGLKTRERDLRSQAAALRTEVARLNNRGTERERLERERKINEEAYLLYEKKARETEVGQVLNRQQVLNFNAVDPPRTDGEIRSPKLSLNLLVLIGLGAFAGLAGAVAAEKLFPGNAENRRANFPVRRMPRIYGLPMLLDDAEKSGQERERKSGTTNAALVPRRLFVEDPEDDKLDEISRFYDLREK